MSRTMLVLALLGLLQGLATVNAQIGSACVLRFDAPKVDTLDSKAAQAVVTAGVTKLASNSTVVFRKGYAEAAILAPVTVDLCDSVPTALPPLLADSALDGASVDSWYEKMTVGARAGGCSFNYDCPWYWFRCTTRRSCWRGRCRNKCYCPSGSCWGK